MDGESKAHLEWLKKNRVFMSSKRAKGGNEFIWEIVSYSLKNTYTLIARLNIFRTLQKPHFVITQRLVYLIMKVTV